MKPFERFRKHEVRGEFDNRNGSRGKLEDKTIKGFT